MGNTTQIYIFAGLFVIITDKKDAYETALFRSTKVLRKPKDKFEWIFYNCSSMTDNDLGLIYSGYLYKIRKSCMDVIFDPEEYRIEEKEINERCEAKSRFIIISDHNLIAYHPNAQFIKKDLFENRFKELFEFRLGIGVVELNPIAEEGAIVDTIRTFSRIDKLQSITVTLFPSNPGSRDIWKPVDDELKKQNISKEISTVSSEDGIDIKDGTRLDMALAMAEDGYGIVDCKRMDDQNRVITWDSADKQVAQQGPTDKATLESVLQSLKQKFKEILKRFIRVKNG